MTEKRMPHRVEFVAAAEGEVGAEGRDAQPHVGSEVGARGEQLQLRLGAADLRARRLQGGAAADVVEVPVRQKHEAGRQTAALRLLQRFCAAAVDDDGILVVFGQEIGVGPQRAGRYGIDVQNTVLLAFIGVFCHA